MIIEEERTINKKRKNKNVYMKKRLKKGL